LGVGGGVRAVEVEGQGVDIACLVISGGGGGLRSPEHRRCTATALHTFTPHPTHPSSVPAFTTRAKTSTGSRVGGRGCPNLDPSKTGCPDKRQNQIATSRSHHSHSHRALRYRQCIAVTHYPNHSESKKQCRTQIHEPITKHDDRRHVGTHTPSAYHLHAEQATNKHHGHD
jgi:hypothetical protein